MTPSPVSQRVDRKMPVAHALREMAALLEAQVANPYRVAACRRAAQAGRLHTIAPRRFYPDGTAWLPVLRTQRGALAGERIVCGREAESRAWLKPAEAA